MCLSVCLCPSVRIKQLALPLDRCWWNLLFGYFHEIGYRSSLHEDQWKFMIISRWILLKIRNVWDKICTQNQKANRAVYEIKKKNTVEPSRLQTTIWRMRIAQCITKATDTHSEYVTLIAFPRHKALRERVSVSCLYIHLPILFQWGHEHSLKTLI